jgi:hypothetical protein
LTLPPGGDRTVGPEVIDMAATAIEQHTGRQRRIGIIGMAARVVLGLLMLESVVRGHLASGFVWSAWALGLVGLPVLVLASQWIFTRRAPARVQATGPVGHALNVAAFLALYLTPSYAPALAFTSDAAVVFYGASMVLAALRGYAGCEVLAVSNWLLRRDDQVGCVVFWPIGSLEARWRT